jgi:hypothetical protein
VSLQDWCTEVLVGKNQAELSTSMGSTMPQPNRKRPECILGSSVAHCSESSIKLVLPTASSSNCTHMCSTWL